MDPITVKLNPIVSIDIEEGGVATIFFKSLQYEFSEKIGPSETMDLLNALKMVHERREIVAPVAGEIPDNLWDEPGEYPSEEALAHIEHFDCINGDTTKLIEFIEQLWWMPDWGFKFNKENKTLSLHTGGWSGNESIMSALQENEFFFTLHWNKTERGGHYYFKLRNVKP